MAIAVAIVLGVLALAFVLLPLYRHAPLAAENTTEQEPVERDARTGLQEVELDYQLGNIAEPDYRTLRERYMRRALVAIRSRYEREQEIDEEIEEQLRKLKEQGSNDTH